MLFLYRIVKNAQFKMNCNIVLRPSGRNFDLEEKANWAKLDANFQCVKFFEFRGYVTRLTNTNYMQRFHCFRQHDRLNTEKKEKAKDPFERGEIRAFDAICSGSVVSENGRLRRLLRGERLGDARGHTWKAISVINVIFCSERPRKWLVDSRRAAHCYIRHDACRYTI